MLSHNPPQKKKGYRNILWCLYVPQQQCLHLPIFIGLCESFRKLLMISTFTLVLFLNLYKIMRVYALNSQKTNIKVSHESKTTPMPIHKLQGSMAHNFFVDCLRFRKYHKVCIRREKKIRNIINRCEAAAYLPWLLNEQNPTISLFMAMAKKDLRQAEGTDRQTISQAMKQKYSHT